MDPADLFAERGGVAEAFDKVDVQVGVDPTGRNSIAAHALRAVVDGDGARQAVQAGF